jgi:hypothetical protein
MFHNAPNRRRLRWLSACRMASSRSRRERASGQTAGSCRRVVIDNTIIKALARAPRWKTMLERDEFHSLTELAEGREDKSLFVVF